MYCAFVADYVLLSYTVIKEDYKMAACHCANKSTWVLTQHFLNIKKKQKALPTHFCPKKELADVQYKL